MADPGPAFEVVSTGGYAAALSRFEETGLLASLVLDGASVPDVHALLDQAGLPFESLLTGPDQEILADEAPMLIALPPEDRAVVAAFQSRLADHPGAAHVLIGHRSQGPQIRRHLRKWLSVHLLRTAPERTPEDKPVLFRFYDPAILGLFLGTLTLSEAAAFAGPVQAWATPGQ